MDFFDDDMEMMDNIRESQKPKDNLRLLMNRKNFDKFELDEILNDF
jgi:hypothetical protein